MSSLLVNFSYIHDRSLYPPADAQLDSTAALAFENGTTLPIASVKGSEAYQFLLAPPSNKSEAPNPYVLFPSTPIRLHRYLLEIVSIEPNSYTYTHENFHLDKPNTTPSPRALIPKVLKTTLNSIKGHCDITLAQRIRTAVLSVPEYVSDETMQSIWHAASQAGFDTSVNDIPRRILRLTNVARVAYNLDTWRGIGVVLDADRDEAGDGKTETHVSLIIDYNYAFMGIGVVGMRSDATLRVGGGVYPELGEGQGDWATVREKLAEELSVHLGDSEGSGDEAGEGDTRLRREDVRAVVFAGDASSAAFASLKTALQDIIPHLYDDGDGRLQIGIEPFYVGAVGAAKRGRDMIDRPEKYMVKLEYTPIVDHEEL